MSTSAPPLHIITVGHVDHGKSTLLGRLLYDTDSLSQEQLAALHEASAAEGKKLELAFVLDAFLEEQAENITMDITHIPFRTSERHYVMMDAPGHKEFLKNMLTGASCAEAAILLISIVDGLQEQTRRHVQLLSLLGIDQVIVVINKLDLVNFSQEAFELVSQLTQKLFQEWALPVPWIIPTAASLGENIASLSSQMPWYEGQTVLQCLDMLTPKKFLEKGPLRFVVQDIYSSEKFPLVVGRVESGSLRVSEKLIFWPQERGERRARVRSIEEWGASSPPQHAFAGESVAITLEESILVQRGDIASRPQQTPLQCTDLNVRLFWLEALSLRVDQKIFLLLGTQRLLARVTFIENIVDATTMKLIQRSPCSLHQHEVADVCFHLHQPLVFDYYDELPVTGRLAIESEKGLVGAGIIIRKKNESRS
ncbi:MAG: hypothetical protein K9M81_00250 [Chthoniobacterales bacterium]|nr:hypothetical protein [Chthoniobacterales bacterium]